MIEKQYVFTQTNTKLIERVLKDDNAGINHMVLQREIHFLNIFLILMFI